MIGDSFFTHCIEVNLKTQKCAQIFEALASLRPNRAVTEHQLNSASHFTSNLFALIVSKSREIPEKERADKISEISLIRGTLG